MDLTQNIPNIALKRIGNGSLLQPRELDWEAGGTFSPAVAMVNDSFIMLYRAFGIDGVSRLGYASSHDGIYWQADIDPRVVPGTAFDKKGLEDPRLVKINQQYLITYTAISNVVITKNGSSNYKYGIGDS
jgi:beta-1,2-mannobiose phosphorylase / 1,2-beta-oligomannan phosphorylase